MTHPKNVPEKISRMRHEVGEFPVHFFGSKDYVWTYQARCFPYMEGDAHNKEKMGKGTDAVYKKGAQRTLSVLEQGCTSSSAPFRTCLSPTCVASF